MNANNRLATLSALSLLVLAGCTEDVETNPPTTPPTGEATAEIRVLHLSPDAPAVDVFANDGDAVVTDLAFPESTSYVTVPAGTYDFDISPAGTSVADSVLAIDGLELAADTKYTAVAINNLASIQALPLVENIEGVSEGQIRVRAIHAAPSIGEVDIWNITDASAPAPLYENVPFAGVGEYLDLPVGEYKIGVDVDDDAIPDVTFDIPAVPAGTVANLFATEDADGNVFIAAQLQDATVVRIDPAPPMAGTSNVRLLHLSPDAGTVDAFVNGERTVEGITFEAGTAYLQVPAGMYTFDIVPAGGAITDSVLTIADISLEADSFYTAAAYGAAATISAVALADNFNEMSAGDIRIRATHAAEGVGEVDIWNVTDPNNPSPLYVDVPYGATGDYLDIPAGAYTIGFDVDNDAVPDLTYTLPELPAGEVANIFAVNDASVFLLAQLSDGTVARVNASPN